jgi:hypothetical protein
MCKEDFCLLELKDSFLGIPFSHVDIRSSMDNVKGLWLEEVSCLATYNKSVFIIGGNISEYIFKLFLCGYESTSETHNEDLVMLVNKLL